MKGKSLGNLFIVECTININITNSVKSDSNYELWHQRLGHIGKSKFLELIKNKMVNDIEQIKHISPDDSLCEACIKGKQARLPFQKAKGAKLDKSFWSYAILTATYLINISLTKPLRQTKTPYEVWHNRKPQIKYLKVFGSTIYVHNKISKSKFYEKSWNETRTSIEYGM